MLWFYLTGVAILVGGEVNAIVEQIAARGRDLERKAEQENFPVGSAKSL